MAIGCAPAWRGVLILLAVLVPALIRTPTAASNDNRLVPYAGADLQPLVLDRLEGSRIGAGDAHGRVSLVHFFATWCEPCRPELASLDKLRTEAGPRGLEILAISVAEVEPRLRRFFADHPVGFPILLDRDRAASRAWAIDALPSTVVLDRAGRARLTVRGDLDWQRPDVRAALDGRKERELIMTTIHRRHLLALGAAGAGAAAFLPGKANAQSAPTSPSVFAPKPGAWRTYEVVTRIDLPAGDAQAWVPVPVVNEAEWFRSSDSTFTVQGGEAKLVSDPVYGAKAVHARWASGTDKPALEVVSRVQARDRAADLSAKGGTSPLSEADRKLYLAATDLIPTGGVVKTTADKITAGRTDDLEKARALYDWVVENSYRNAATRGCGIGDVAAMLTSGNLGGKCADLNALFVGLARAAGIPARDVYGLRVAPSAFGYKSLGAGSEVVTKAQHCRAEAWLDGHGWVAVDPADVRKVVLEEPPGKLALDDPKVAAARRALFGSWEGNWLAYNFAHDLALPGAAGPKVAFHMYPEAEVKDVRLDCLDPDTFRYAIRAREVSV